MKGLISPMKAHIGTEKDLERADLIFEPKLDGIRAICYVNNELQFYSRNDINITKNYPEFDFRDAIQAKSAVLDGEIVVLDKAYSPRFSLWQQGYQAIYIVFDILMLNGKQLFEVPLLERKELLEKAVINGPRIEKCLYTTNGKALWHIINQRHMEGVMAKVAHSFYYPGKRSKLWIKIKAYKTLEAIIIGYTSGKRAVSSLVLGIYDAQGTLIFIGKVGTGFSEAFLKELRPRLASLESSKPTVTTKERGIIWVKPELVCQIKYLEFTDAGILRAPVFLRLRPDKDSREVTFKEQEIRAR
jgi:bifunctional non-homologous end joining protein LigD